MTESISTTQPASAQALQTLEENGVFDRCAGLLRLLRFLLEASEKDPDAMKETYVGTAFYNRDATYDPRYDSIVRVNVMRLRQRLAEYYAGPGANDRVTLEIPRGSYIPLVTVKPAPMYKRRAADLAPVPPAAPVELPPSEPAGPSTPSPRRLLLWAISTALVLLATLILYLLASRYFLASHPHPGFVGAVFEKVPLIPGRDLSFAPRENLLACSEGAEPAGSQIAALG